MRNTFEVFKLNKMGLKVPVKEKEKKSDEHEYLINSQILIGEQQVVYKAVKPYDSWTN